MDDDGDVLAAWPTPLVEVRPQPGVLRHTAAHIVDFVRFVQLVQILACRRPIEVPKLSQDRISQRSVNRRPQKAEQSVEVPTIVVLLFSHSSRLPSRPSTFQFRVVEVVVDGEIFKVFPQDRVQQHGTVEQNR